MSQDPPEYGPPSQYGAPSQYGTPPPPGYGPPPGPYVPAPGYGQQYGPPPGQPSGLYGQQPPGPQPMGPVTTQFARIDPGPSQAFGGLGATITALGGILLVVAFTAVNWFEGSGQSHVSNVHSVLSAFGDLAAGPAKLYFSWLGWTLLVIATITGLIAAIPTVGRVFRAIAPVVAAGGLVATFLAVRLVGSSGPASGGILYSPTDATNELPNPGLSYFDYLKEARLGFYLALAGFVLVGVGALIGPRNRRG